MPNECTILYKIKEHCTLISLVLENQSHADTTSIVKFAEEQYDSNGLLSHGERVNQHDGLNWISIVGGGDHLLHAYQAWI